MRKYFPYGVLVVISVLTILSTWRLYHCGLAHIFIPLLIWGAVDYFRQVIIYNEIFHYSKVHSPFIESQNQ